MKRRGYAIAGIWVLLCAVAMPTHGLTEPCGQPTTTAEGNFFTDYESVEYSPEGNLMYRFRINPALATGSNFQIAWTFFDDSCAPTIGGADQSPLIKLPAGVTDWSVRVVSPTQLAVWDDQNDAAVATFSIPAFPPYTRIHLRGNAPGAFSRTFESQTVRMFENAEAPAFEQTIEKSEACPEFSATGNGVNQSIFDTYERAEYVDGLLRVHLRFRNLVGGNKAFFSKALAVGEDCTVTVPPFGGLNTQLTTILRYYSFRMVSPNEWQLWDDDRNEPLTCAGCSGTIPEDTTYVAFYTRVNANWGPMEMRTTPFPPTAAAEPAVPDPVIIIPGILGSEKNSDGVWVIDPILHTYDDLIATLDVNHYTPEVDLFTFPYNWRQSNVDTAVQLKAKIDEVKGICGCEKVDLVAHSMGGLVARQYIQSDAYENDVDQLIFLGTPHLGAPKAYLMWEGGEVGPQLDPVATLMEIILRHEAYEQGFPHLFNYLRTIPVNSVRELLPIYDYIFDGSLLREYPNNYPQNLFLETLNENIDSLLNSGVELHNFIGSNASQKTITAIDAVHTDEYIPKWGHGYPDGFYDLFGDHGLLLGSGDQTVPLNSASFVNVNLTVSSSVHNALPEDLQSEIFEVLTDTEPITIVDNTHVANIKLILIKILSPADLFVIAPDGKKIGKENGQAVNEIPNAFYTGFNTDAEFITILNPLDGEYKVYTEGIGFGTYTVETAYISERATTEASFTSDTMPGQVTELVVFVDNENPETMDVLPTALNELITLLRGKIQALDIKESLKNKLLKRIEGLENKIDKKKEKNAKILAKLEKKMSKQEMKGKIDTANASEIIALLEILEAQSEGVTLDAEVLAELKGKIESLDIKQKSKNDLLKRIEKLENQQTLTKHLTNTVSTISKKAGKGKISDGDAQALLDLLGQVENAI